MWCWGTCARWRWQRFSSAHVWLTGRTSCISLCACLSSSGVHQLLAETWWGAHRAGESHQEAEEAGDGLQRVWAAESLLPAPQHIPAQAHPAPHALQTHLRETLQALFSHTPRPRRLQGSVSQSLHPLTWTYHETAQRNGFAVSPDGSNNKQSFCIYSLMNESEPGSGYCYLTVTSHSLSLSQVFLATDN